MIYKIWISLEHQAENKNHSEFDMPKLLGVFDTQAQAEKFFKLIVGFCDSFGSGIMATAIPPDPQHGREPCKTCDGSGKDPNQGSFEPCPDCKPEKVKPLAQYLVEYLHHEIVYDVDRELLEQALDAYQSTENVTIKIKPV